MLARKAEQSFLLSIAATVAILLTIVATAGVKFTVRSMLIAHYAPEFNLKAIPVQPQWGIIALFVVSLLIGLGAVTWMVVQLQRTYPEKEQPAME